ncbi:hypothetical protein ABK040_003186 [Willaertia magna]
MNTQQVAPTVTITLNTTNAGGVLNNNSITNNGINNIHNVYKNNNNSNKQPDFTFGNNNIGKNKNGRKKRSNSTQEDNNKLNTIRKSTLNTIKGTKVKGFCKNITRAVILFNPYSVQKKI